MNRSRHDSRRQDRQGHRSRGSHGRQNRSDDSEIQELCHEVVLLPKGEPPVADLFDGIASRAAKIVANEKTRTSQKTKTSQLRRFYDELLRWEDKVNSDPNGSKERLRKHLPFIRMMNAKAAYAEGRGLVGSSFVALLRRCLEQVNDDPKALRNCKLFFEAFMGFYKLHGPSGLRGESCG